MKDMQTKIVMIGILLSAGIMFFDMIACGKTVYNKDRNV